MEASFVSRARTAINSAAAKAEKVFTKKSNALSPATTDLSKQSPRASTPESPEETEESRDLVDYASKRARAGSTKITQDLQDTLQRIVLSRKGSESEKAHNSVMAYAIFDENLYMMGEREFSQSKDSEDGDMGVSSKPVEIDIIPSSVILKQLAAAIEASSTYNSIKEVQASSKASSPIKDRAGVSFSSVKSLMLREREDKVTSNFSADENVASVINTLVNVEGHFTAETMSDLEFRINATTLIKDIHGAPVESLVFKLSEALGRLRTLKKMASFWFKFVAELRSLWLEGQYLPGIALDEKPDLNCCLLYQQLQVINCCISRKRRHAAAVESLESLTKGDRSHANISRSPYFYAKTKSGELVLRLGADRKSDKLTILETGEPVYSPVLQEPPLLTEDVVKETEEFVLRTGSVGAGCSQLLSDMQAFKAANPGCILGDFVRWHSPPDWTVDESIADMDGDLSFSKGQLSRRMQKEGNMWRELWETSKPVPAVRQSPLYDEDLAVEGILDYLEEIPPYELLKQLFVALLGSGLVISEFTLSANPTLSNMLAECKNYIVFTCQSSSWVEKLDDICQVYETVERMALNPDGMSKSFNEETASDPNENKNRFKRLSSIFRGKNRTPSKNNENSNSMLQPLSSIFSRKPPQPQSPSPSSGKSVENDWTIV